MNRHFKRTRSLFKIVALSAALVFSLSSCRILALEFIAALEEEMETGQSSGGSSGGSGGTTTGTTRGGSSGSGGTSSGSSTSRGTTILSASTDLSWSDTIDFDKSYFSGFTSGSQIRITATNTGSSYHVMKLYSPTAARGWQPLASGTITNAALSATGEITPAKSSGSIVYTVTSTEADNLRRYGMLMHGDGIRVSRIDVLPSGGAATSGGTSGTGSGTSGTGGSGTQGTTSGSSATGTTIYTGNFDLANWTYFDIPASAFSGAKKGSVISIITTKSTSINNPSTLNLKLYSNNTWQPLTDGALSGATQNGDIFVPRSANGTVSYTLTEQDAAALKRNGLIIQGYALKVTKVTLSATGSGTSSTASGNGGGSATSPSSVPRAPSGSPVAVHGALSVNGAQLVDKNGRPVQLYGMSTHGLSWYPEYVNYEGFKTLRDDWNTNCVRLVLYPRDSNGYLTGGNKAQLKQTIYNGIDYATRLGMYVIVDWHVHNYNPNETKAEAITFFRELSAKYRNYDNIIYEICNEPTGAAWSSAIKPYAEAVIPVIRGNDSDAIVIVGTNTWSQDIEGPTANPLSYRNVMYAFHFYANTHTDAMRQRVETALRAGTPVFISEFGTCDASGNGGFNTYQTQQWFRLIEQYNISHMNWSLCNKAETASAISSRDSSTSGWSQGNLTESGKLVRNHFRTLSQ